MTEDKHFSDEENARLKEEIMAYAHGLVRYVKETTEE